MSNSDSTKWQDITSYLKYNYPETIVDITQTQIFSNINLDAVTSEIDLLNKATDRFNFPGDYE